MPKKIPTNDMAVKAEVREACLGAWSRRRVVPTASCLTHIHSLFLPFIQSSAQPSPTPVSNGHSNAPTPDPPTTAPTGPPIIVPDPETALLASSRLDEINKLREDRVRLETTLDALRTQVEHPSESVIAQSELFKQLLAQVSFFKAEASQAKAHFEKLAAEVDSLRDGRQDFEDSAIVRGASFTVDSVRD